ncbi:MAG: Gfo/Idh/MocA family oxidoreductase [Saprospiraceae bacterium]|nr:Gfo/Idh/MocA family oxidoreductase [Saprospiraceae bacterium]
MTKKTFALIGAAGYIAPRHMEAIKACGHDLVTAYDKNDSVGIIDRYFPNADFFTEFERFDRHLEKLKRKGLPVDYVTICSPNYLHDAHIRFGLRLGANVICEKPLVLNPWNIDGLQELERETGKKVNTILQLRLHESVIALKEKVDAAGDTIFDVDLTYLTSRGKWYYASWKGDISKSGGIATNIGVHFFDMLAWVFGPIEESVVHIHEHDRAAGYIKLKKARVRWFLSINFDCLPGEVKARGLTTYRSIQIGGEEFEFSGGFTELHTRSYQSILDGEGFDLEENRTAIQMVHDIRKSTPVGLTGNYHPLAELPLAPHPFASSREKGE